MQKLVFRSALGPNQISFSHSQDPWEKAADCVRALAATNEPTKREILTNVRNLWMGLAEQHSFMSDFELAKQIEVIGRIHSGLRGA